jgi:hypothetical protein
MSIILENEKRGEKVYYIGCKSSLEPKDQIGLRIRKNKALYNDARKLPEI